MQQITQHFYSPRLGLFLIRLVAGVIFIYHGAMKLSSMEGTIAFFGSLGVSAFFAWVVALVELLGGISLVIGLWSRFFSAALAIVMIFAIILVKGKMGFVAAEIDMMLLATALAVLFSGCGKYSVCAMNHHKGCSDCHKGDKCGCAHGNNQ